jgi:uncharacterized protein (TIGR02757 family)
MNISSLKKHLDNLYRKYDIRYLSPDPVELVHPFSSPEDRETAGLLAASLAYGRVDRILVSIRHILSVMDNRPCAFVKRFDPKRDKKKFKRFVHRFNTGEDVACFVYMMKQVLDAHGSLHHFFKKGYRKEDKNIAPALSCFIKGLLALDTSPFYKKNGLPQDAGVRYFLPSPENGSACKRPNLFLRWMIRQDAIDFGIWKDISPSKLIIPLDTHVARISKNLGLTVMKSPGWKMAEDITLFLKRLDPNDPVKYDFSLSRLGIMSLCNGKKDGEKCKICDLKKICSPVRQRAETPKKLQFRYNEIC